MEGPTLPGRVKRKLHQMYDDNVREGTSSIDSDTAISESTEALSTPPNILAIGGIDKHNCCELITKFRLDGLVTIRTVRQSSDPKEVVQRMKSAM